MRWSPTGGHPQPGGNPSPPPSSLALLSCPPLPLLTNHPPLLPPSPPLRHGPRAERRRRPGALHPVPGPRPSAAARSGWCRYRSACRSPRQSASSTPCSRPRRGIPRQARAAGRRTAGGPAAHRATVSRHDKRDAHRRQPGGHHRRLRRPGGQLLRLHRGPHRRQRARRHRDQLRHRPVPGQLVDAAGRPVPPGTPSAKVLITNLHNLTLVC